jgi:hypothetical protein
MNNVQAHVNALAAQVKAVNAANAAAIRFFPILKEAMKEFVGKSVLKVDGRLTKKVTGCVPDFSDSNVLQVYKHWSENSLAWVFKACENRGDNGCVYHEKVLYVGTLTDGVLTSLQDSFTARTDYTVEEVTAKREAVEVAEKAARAAMSDLTPFSRY